MLLVAVVLAACGQSGERPQLRLAAASIVQTPQGSELHADLQFRPSVVQLDALQQGVPLTLRVRVTGATRESAQLIRLTLRYFPLSGRYQLRVQPGGDSSYALRGYLFDALQRLRVPLSHDPCAGSDRCRVEAGLDYAALPGALRLPALLRSAWRVPQTRIEAGDAP